MRAHLVCMLLLLPLSPAVVVADPIQVPGENSSSLPGIDQLVFATPLATGLTGSLFAGYGYTEAMLEANDVHHRAFWSLAASYRLRDWIALAARFDGRYDKHLNLDSGNDDSLVVDPRISVLINHSLGAELSIGGLVSLWMPPGADSFSIEPQAFSPSLLFLATYNPAGTGLLLAANAGFELDRSGNAIDSPDVFSRADRLALGLSDSSFVPVSLGAAYRLGNVEILGEWGWNIHVGSEAPSMRSSPMYISAGGRMALGNGPFQVQVLASADLSRRPEVDVERPLVPVEPRFRLTAGITFVPLEEEEAPPRILPEKRDLPKPPAQGSLRIVVTTQGEAPIPGAMVLVNRLGKTSTVTTDEAGQAEVLELDPGPTSVSLRAEGYVPTTTPINITSGSTANLALKLQEALPEGEIRGTIRAFDGRGLPATLTLEPLGQRLTAAEDGSFSIVVPPGRYDVVVRARGFREQRRSIVVETQGVTVLNVDLRAQ